MIGEGFAHLKSRLYVGAFAIALVSALIYGLQFPSFFPFFTALMALLAGVGCWEYGSFVRKKQVAMAQKIAPLFAALYIFSRWVELVTVEDLGVSAFVLTLAVMGTFFAYFKEPEGVIEGAATTLFALFYIGGALGYFVDLAFTPYGGGWLALAVWATKVGDMGAYFVGRGWGKRPMAPRLSPKKTYEGLFAALFFSALAAYAFTFLGHFSTWLVPPLTGGESLWVGALLALVGQLGDLGESALKRDAGVKDSNCIPGLGGVLDMLDSLLFTVPFVYFYGLWR